MPDRFPILGRIIPCEVDTLYTRFVSRHCGDDDGNADRDGESSGRMFVPM